MSSTPCRGSSRSAFAVGVRQAHKFECAYWSQALDEMKYARVDTQQLFEPLSLDSLADDPGSVLGWCRVFESLEHPGSAALLHPRRLKNVCRHSTRMNTGNTDIGIGQFNIEALAEAGYR